MFEIRPSPRHGRGLFATRAIAAGRRVAVCPALLLDPDDRDAVEGTPVAHMLVEWDDSGVAGLPLGEIALVNHADSPNCELVTDDAPAGPNVELWAREAVRRGQELTIDYVAGSDRPLWFDPA